MSEKQVEKGSTEKKESVTKQFPTLSELRKKRDEEEAAEEEQEKQRLKDLQVAIQKIKLHVAATESSREKFRATAFENKKARWYEVSCDSCGIQLYNPSPGTSYPSKPKLYDIACVGCGWTGLVSQDDV